MTETAGSVIGILESYTADSLKEKLDKLDVLLKACDVRSKQPIVFSKFSNRSSSKGKHFCADCGKRLKTHGAERCSSCNMRLVGRNHVQTRKKKGGS